MQWVWGFQGHKQHFELSLEIQWQPLLKGQPRLGAWRAQKQTAQPTTKRQKKG